MRTTEQFKELVYKKADDLNAKNRKNRAILMRSVAAFSLVLVVGGVFIYGNFHNKNNSAESMIALCEDAAEFYSGNSLSDFALGVENGAASKDAEAAQEKIQYSAFDLSSDGTSESFSYEDETSNDNLYGATTLLSTTEDAIEVAKSFCTVEYDTTDVYYDEDTDTWKVVFYKQNVAGGSQDVCLGSDGTVKMIAYGE